MTRRFLGSWHIFCDVAGRVSRRNHSPLLTIGAIAIPEEILKAVRSRLLRRFDGKPIKWSAGGLVGFSHCRSVIRTHALPVLIKHIYRETPDAWTSFWDHGDEFVKRLDLVVGDRTRGLASDTTLKMFLFAGAFGALVGYLLKAGGVTVNAERDGLSRIELTMVNDSDIQDDDTRRLFSEYVMSWPERTGRMAELGIEPHATARFAREQDEPLLLLPDYMAGTYHHADPRARLLKPVAGPDAVRQLVEEFEARHGHLLLVQRDEFEESYPLDFKGDDVIRRTR